MRYLARQSRPDAFQMLGVTPLLGRWFRLEENEASAEPVVLLGYDLWQQRYAGNPAVVGKTVEVNGLMATIIGVMPKGWRYPEQADLWMPLRFDEKKDTRGRIFSQSHRPAQARSYARTGKRGAVAVCGVGRRVSVPM